jgi:gliding motility-associated-like protein
VGIVGLYNRVKISPVRVIFLLCHIFVIHGKSQAPVFNWMRNATASSEQEGFAVASDQYGNVYETGFIKGSGVNFSSVLINSAGGEDIFISKYDQNGNILWAKPAGGSGDDRGQSIAVDTAGNVYVCGYIAGSATFFGSPNITVSVSGTDIFIAKYNSSGNVVWVKRADASNNSAARGICTNGVDVFITGEFSGNVNFGAINISSGGAKDMFIASYNCATGAEQWAIKGGGSIDDFGTSITMDNTGIYATGSFQNTGTFQNMSGSMSSNGNEDVYVLKYNFAGTGLWKCKAGGSNDDHETSICTNGTYVYVAGHYAGLMTIYNSGLTAVSSMTAAAADDAFLIQYDAASGNYGWSHSENGTGNDRARSVAVNDNGEVFVTGEFDGTLPLSPGPSVTTSGNVDVFITKYNPAGTLLWGKKAGGSAEDLGMGIVAPDNSSIYIGGYCKSTPSTFDAFSFTANNYDIFLTKIGCSCSVANAGADVSYCLATSANLNANTAWTGTGVWTLVSGTATIASPSSSSTAVNGLSTGANVFKWKITNSVCPASDSDLITITIDVPPTTANAGPDQTFCSSSGTLTGNFPSLGSGTWTRISGGGAPTSPSSSTSGVTGLVTGANVFQWTIANGACLSSDQVTLNIDPNPTTANAGADQNVCSATAILAGNNPAIGTGTWTLVSGTGTITNPSLNNSAVNGLSFGPNVFRWTTSNGTCPNSSDLVTINQDQNPTTANAGPDVNTCNSSISLAGNVPSIGTGTWSLVSGTGTIVTPNSATSTVTGLSVGANVFKWTISNGTCASSSDNVTITRDASPTTANAGPDQNICNSSATLAGNIPSTGTGTWSLVSGTGIITNASLNNSTVTGLSVGNNIFQWTISNGTCTASSDQVIIHVDAFPSVADAGPDQNVCTSTATLAGNTPAVGTGAWSLVSGTGSFTNSTSPTSGVTGLSVGANVFKWTITSGTCASSFDNVTITRDANPSIANAGPDQTLCTSSTTLAGNVPAIGTGTWSLISGTGSITTPSSNNSGVTGLVTGNATFQWTISNGTCPSSSDQVVIIHDANPSVANAGPDQNVCSATATLAGNVPTTGTGTWTLISGTGTATTPTSASSGITGMSTGANTFRWTISNGTCPSSSDNVVITRDANPTTANAGPDQTLCTSSTTLAGNNPAIGTGTWSLISGIGTVTAPSSNTSGVTGLVTGNATFRWTISNGTCPSSIDDVIITHDANPTVAVAGPDQLICSANSTFAGNIPTTGTGTWSLVSGTGSITTPSSASSGVTTMSVGANTFRWTISNGTCPSSSDDVIITRSANPSTANAGPDQNVCTSSATLAGNAPAIGTGTWTLVSGTGNITTASSPASGVTGLVTGNAVFQWTISNGACPSSSDQVTIIHDANPTVSNAGPDQTLCSGSSSFAGNVPSTGTGFWTLISGSGVPTTPSSATSAITGLGTGANTFRWTISNGTCPSSSDDVIITRNANPTTANAGPDQTLCSSAATLAGNTPSVGSGTWTTISGSGTVTSPASPSSGVTGLSIGANVFQWTISNGTCPSSSDQVTINRDANPTAANAGPDQSVCSASSSFAGNAPAIGSGVWTLISGTGTISTPLSNTSNVTALGNGANTFRWTISNGTCPSSSDDVILTRDAVPTIANAGLDQSVCSATSSFNGNTPVTGTGLWTLVSGTGTITNPTSPTSAVTGLSVGANVFQWTISNGTCASSSDQVTITRDANPTTANAGPDQTICSTNSVFAGNTPTIGTGTWSLVSGTGSITTPSSATSTVVGLNTGNAVFQWTISNGTCPSSSDQVIITRNPSPSIANAGPDQTICSSSATLAGNVPVVGTGTWTLVSGTGTITSPTTSNSSVTGLSVGANVFQWTITSGVCAASSDQVTINVDPNPTISNPGTNQTICSSSATLNANTPSIGTGAWTLVSGSATIASPSSPNSALTGIGVGTNIFQWTISNGTCPASSNQVTITRDAYPTGANAGLDQTICSSSATMDGNVPVTGVGTWSLVSGTGNFSAPNSAGSPVSGIGVGTSVYQWTISNGVCPSTSDQVTITVDENPSLANAGPDQAICATSSTLSADIPTVGTGVWTLFSGTGVIITPGSATTSITGMSSGSNIFQWTVSNGACPSSVDQVTIFKDPEPTTANAGPDQTICSSSSSFAANIPTVGNGMWSLVSGTGSINNTSSPTSGVTGLSIGANVFCWTITHGICPPSTDTVVIYVDPNPSASSAGIDQVICSATTSLNGNFPAIGNGAWTLISGTGTIVSPSSPNSTIVGLGIGANVFQWTISNGTCPSTSDQVIVSRDPVPTTANAGTDQTICAASTNFAGNTPVTGTGTWYLVSGTGSIVTPNSPTSVVNGLSIGANVFRWRITNGVCNASEDTVIIYRDPNPTASDAGTDQTICSSASSLSGNVPSLGSGNWTLISGAGTIVSPGSPSSSVSGLNFGANVFRWTISNGSCPSSFDDVTINVDANPTMANAGNDQSICASVFALNGNIPLTGNGNWNVLSGPGIISNSTQPGSGVTNLATGNNVFEWVISNGTCPSSRDTVSIFVDQYPTTSNAGTNQETCSSASILNGNIPLVGTGTWLIVNSTGNFSDAALPNSGITNLAYGNNTFEWVIANGTCPVSRDTVSILVDENPSLADAGTDQVICAANGTLHAAQPAIGVGAWNVLSGSGTIANPLLLNAAVSNLAMGQNKFQWTVSSGVCPVTVDTVQIYVDSFPSMANAGNPQTICSSSSSLNANTPAFGTGSWNILSGTGILADPSQPGTSVSNLSYGQNTFEWTISSGSCPSTRDTVTIHVDRDPTIANAGVDELICDPFDTLNGNIPLVGNGAWYAINSPPLIGSPYTASTPVSNLVPGWNPFEWVISNGVCPASHDTVSIFYTIRPSAPDAGPDIYECAYDVNMQAEIPVIGTGLWNNLSNTGSFADANDPNSALNNLPAGSYLYTWTVSNSYCVSHPDTVMVSVFAPPSNADAGADQLVHTGIATMHAVGCDTGAGTWSFVSGSGQIEDPHDPQTRVNDLSEGVNVLRWTTSNGVCSEKTDDVQVENKSLLIPAGYSPNNDGVNDFFEIDGLSEYQNVSLEVFNRWGNQVYIASDYKNDWNGSGTNGEILPEDVYYFILKLDDGTTFTGYVALKRSTL